MHGVMSDQSTSIEELSVIRDRKIINLVNHAYEYSPYYQTRFDEIGIHPSQIKGYNDLVNLPVLTKLDILTNEIRLIGCNWFTCGMRNCLCSRFFDNDRPGDASLNTLVE